jgi:hypothetical protein
VSEAAIAALKQAIPGRGIERVEQAATISWRRGIEPATDRVADKSPQRELARAPNAVTNSGTSDAESKIVSGCQPNTRSKDRTGSEGSSRICTTSCRSLTLSIRPWKDDQEGAPVSEQVPGIVGIARFSPPCRTRPPGTPG